jgi:glycosyltransferase involved in cell wall biosynthesis
MAITYFSDVTLLITHYNRSTSLERLLISFAKMGVQFAEIIVSDDGSKPVHLNYLKGLEEQYKLTLITTEKNKGLGNNINKGQQAVKTTYVLYIQEDFEPKIGFIEHFKNALTFMQEDAGLDIVRFYAYFKYPYLKPYGKGFSEMIFNPSLLANNHLKYYVYSDHPHLRRGDFYHKFGLYKEGVIGDVTEYLMALAFIQKKGRGLFFDNFNDLFWQKNTETEPSTMARKSWRESKNPVFLAIRKVYLQFKLLKWTYNYYFKNTNNS